MTFATALVDRLLDILGYPDDGDIPDTTVVQTRMLALVKQRDAEIDQQASAAHAQRTGGKP